jgi:NAD+ synthase (glutamine-hydrolysing)
MTASFFHIHRHDFVRVAAAVPEVALANRRANVARVLAQAVEADRRGASICVFPELCLTGWSCDDLFHQQALLDAAKKALARVVRESASLRALIVVGLPLEIDGALYNVAALVLRGRILGWCPRVICRTTASSTSCGSSRRALERAGAKSRSMAKLRRSGRT